VIGDLHAEVTRFLGDRLADAAEADDAKLPIADLRADHEIEREPLPIPSAHQPIAFDDAPRDGKSVMAMLAVESSAHLAYW
jgi:hypothetical protein